MSRVTIPVREWRGGKKMHRYLTAPAVCLILSGVLVCPVANSQTNKTFPTDDEITLVVTQTERALSDYEASVKLEAKLANQAADVENDKRVIKGMTVMVKALREHPQRFNSPVGFEFVLLLDDASRNAALCNADAIQKGMKVTIEGDRSAGQNYLQLAQACTGASNLLYNVSETAGALYQRYVNGEESLAIDAVNTMNQCVAKLKQSK
jgi:hypothetical protein